MWMSAKVFLLLVVVVVMIDHVVAFDKCKKTLTTVFLDNRCRLRNKRSSASTSELTHHHVAKRQIMSIREIFVASRVPIYQVPYPNYARHQYAPAVPPSPSDIYRVQRPKPESLPQESHSEVGFDMTYEEMIEFFNEIYNRLPRGTKSREEIENKVLPLFEECCKNIEVCLMKKAEDCPFL